MINVIILLLLMILALFIGLIYIKKRGIYPPRAIDSQIEMDIFNEF